jgi:hypothetical protein
VLVAATCAGVHWGANVGYDDALVAFEDAVDEARTSRSALESTAADLTETMDAAAVVAGARTDLLMDAANAESLDEAAADARGVADDAAALADDRLPEASDKPAWAWELFDETSQLNEERDQAAEQSSDFDEIRADAEAASAALQDAGIAAVLAAADAADGFEAAHVSARNLDILDLRRQAQTVSGAVLLDSTTAEAYTGLETAAAAMITSEKAELAEKQGPLLQARTEIEAFARDLAPGVLLDFDWSALVNGYGYGDSMGGYATWWYGDPGYSTIELSNSVAEYWPGDRSKALVAHEVGHAISVKCEGMYDDSDQGVIEAWATAWAISKGFTDAANGTSAYGAPSQSLIDAAAGCR